MQNLQREVPDEIQLLSDHIANQIAAGEVIQRPASAVKELLENAIDAGATEIQLIIKDSGKELIQVIDNGKGMSPTDARMSFERHATSKIKNIEDLFTIRTMGFRGEALASIAAVAQVELRTNRVDGEPGTRIVIEGTEVKLQEPCPMNKGTNLMVKNLFYNVPARRHFLKSGTTEFRNILDEFTRIALAYPNIAFRLWHNGTEQFHLSQGNLKSRIIALLGGNFEKKLVPVEQKTEVLDIYGFVGKPETAFRTRGNQYFFINGRFIRNAYLNHAVTQSYESLIEKDKFPLYVLFLDIDPARVDVNVHPTKQEVKFEDDRLMYSYLQAAVKHALASNNIAPSIDFTLNPEITSLPAVQLPVSDREIQSTQSGYLQHVFSDRHQAHVIEKKDSLRHWKELYEVAKSPAFDSATNSSAFAGSAEQASLMPRQADSAPVQSNNNKLLIHGTYLATTVKSGMMMIHVGRAQERIWYERMLRSWNNQDSAASQRVLFPASYEFSPQDAALLHEVIPELARIGLEVSHLGKETFVVQGVPMGLHPGEEKEIIEDVIEQLKHESPDAVTQRTDMILARVAKTLSTGSETLNQPAEQQALIDELFATTQPEYTPGGKKIFALIKKDELDNMLS